MEFNENQVYLIGALIGVLLSLPFTLWMGKYTQHYIRRHGLLEKITRKSLFSLIFIIVILTVSSIYYNYADVICVVIIGYLIDCLFIYKFLKKHFPLIPSPEDAHSKIDNQDRIIALYISACYSALLAPITFGTIAATLWLMPDIIVVSKKGDRFFTREHYTLPFSKSLSLGHSYIDNNSPDTIFRITVIYAILGEEVDNLYSLDAKYAPGQFACMPSKVNRAMKIIPPIMLPTINRTGKHHTKRAFLTDYNHLLDFQTASLNEYGIRYNVLVDSIPPPRYGIIREDTSFYYHYRYVNPNPYPRLRNKDL